MSYILEALKKLEQKRRREEEGPIPITFQGQTYKEPGKRRIWIYVLSAILVMSAGLFAWQYSPWGKGPPAKGVVKAAPAPALPVAKNLEEKGPEDRAKNLEAKADTGPFAPQGPEQKAKGLETKTDQGPPSPPAPRKAGPPEAPPKPAPPPGPAAEPKQPVEPKRAPQARQAKTPVPVEQPSAEAFPRAEPKPPPGGKVLKLSDLPASVVSALPELKMSLHYYIGERKLRFARINDLTLKEGENLSDGLKLDEVTQTGAVMNYKGWRFLVPVTP